MRTRLLAAALDVFAERGYAGAATREISRRADVAEVLLFDHFGNKARLYEQAVLVPFERFVAATSRKWVEHRAAATTLEGLVREYIDGLYRFCEENRRLFLALLSAGSHNPANGGRLEEVFSQIQRMTQDAAVQFGLPVRNLALNTRLTFGLVMSAAIYGELLFPTGDAVRRAAIVEELTDYLLHGVNAGSGLHADTVTE